MMDLGGENLDYPGRISDPQDLDREGNLPELNRLPVALALANRGFQTAPISNGVHEARLALRYRHS